MTDAPRQSLRSLLEPSSVAIIGASQDPTRIGGRTLSYMIKGGFAGRIVPVSATRAEVQGLPAFADIGAAPGDIEAAIVALPAELTVKVVRDCAAKGVRSCIVFSSGFSETGETGRAAEQELAAIARSSGMRILGPNCLGLFTPHVGFYGCFSNTLDRALPERGALSIVSQSGAFGTHLYYLARERGLGLRTWISTGNECDVQAAECLSHVVDDPGTKVVILYLEGARDGRALRAALEKARLARKPVVAIKVGRSEAGRAAAASHTAAMAGGDAIYDAVFRSHGVWRAQSAEEAVDIAYACAAGHFPAGRRLGIVTISGGGGILMSDVAADYGLELPPMPDAAQAVLRERLPYCAPRNPVDITAQAFNQMDLFASNLEIIVTEGGYDAVVAFLTTVPGSASIRPPLKAALRELRRRHPDRLIVLSMLVPPDLLRDYEAEGFPIFEDANRAVRAVAGLVFFAEAFARPAAGEPGVPLSPFHIPGKTTERDALELLRSAGVTVVRNRLCRAADEAVEAFLTFAGPVALKISSADLPHKTEIGGVVLGVSDEAAVRRAFGEILERARRATPEAQLDGILVAPMVSDHVEVIVGAEVDPVFGPVVMVGLGGIFAEILGDAQLALAPVDAAEAAAMIRAMRGYPMLAGARGRPPADLAALARLIARVSSFALAAENLRSLDINPVAVLPQGRGCLALDAAIHVQEPDSTQLSPVDADAA